MRTIHHMDLLGTRKLFLAKDSVRTPPADGCVNFASRDVAAWQPVTTPHRLNCNLHLDFIFTSQMLIIRPKCQLFPPKIAAVKRNDR